MDVRSASADRVFTNDSSL